MKLLFLEALFVGLYSAFIFNILFFVIKNEYILLFTLGFIKHFISYYIGIQTFFCNHGYECKKLLNNSIGMNKIRYVATNNNLFIESLLEGLWFLLTGAVVFSVIGKMKPYIVMFIIGFFTHLIVEKFEIHKYFCKHNCQPFVKA
jgi:hypothetical protein